MANSSTLKVGDKAPHFELLAANMGLRISLPELLKHGPVILEFLRGTW